MSLTEALEVVMGLAEGNMIDWREVRKDPDLRGELDRQQAAFVMIEVITPHLPKMIEHLNYFREFGLFGNHTDAEQDAMAEMMDQINKAIGEKP
jgi:hypothetical protein